MANDKDKGNDGLPVNFELINKGKVETLPGIRERGSDGNPGGDKWLEFIKSKHGIEGPTEPESEKSNPDQESLEKAVSIQRSEPEKDEPEKE
jgi:hypothetical protein